MSKIVLPKLSAPQRIANLAFELPDSTLARWNAGLQAKDDDNTISIYDPIGFDYWSGEGVTAKRISAALRAIGDREVVVNINSPGGDVFEGIAIYNLLRDHPHEVTVRVLGSAFSAASLIAMAGDKIQIARAGFLMIHNVWMVAMGNRNDLRAAADVLEPIDDALADVYAARTGGDKAEMAALMDKETWMSGSQAIERGFADGLLPADEIEEEDTADADSSVAALRRVDTLLAKAGLRRAQRRSLLNLIKGTPDAARDATHDAGEVVNRMIDLCGSVAKPNPFL